MVLAGSKSLVLVQLHAVWMEFGGRSGVELTAAAMASVGLVLWAVSWLTQRDPLRR
jgi:hypothetical protein